MKAWAKDGKNMGQFMELISGEKPGLSIGSQVRDTGSIIADKKAFGYPLSDGFERANDVVKAKQSKIDRYTKTLQQASEALLEPTRDPAKLSKNPKKARVLGATKERVDYLPANKVPRSRRWFCLGEVEFQFSNRVDGFKHTPGRGEEHRLPVETISPEEWLGDPAITPGSQKNRRLMMAVLLRANGCGDPEDLVSRCRSGDLSPYDASRKFLTLMLRTQSPGTTYSYRSMLPGFLESTLGESNFSRGTFNRLVPRPKPYVTVAKKISEPDGVKAMLTMSNPQYKAIIGGLAVTGMRIMEWLTRKNE